jgi:hypothetical protein
MSRRLGERRQLARQRRKRLTAYLYWLEACGRDEAKANRVLLAARAELGRLVSLDAAASGIGRGRRGRSPCLEEVRPAGHRVSQRTRPPTSSVITAATPKDRIEADIQLAGVKPMRRPNDVHADTHHDT